MRPIEQAESVYDREPCARTFAEDVEAHALNGYVISTPDLFVMARLVPRHAPPAEIVNPWHAWPAGTVLDCWHLYLVAGDMSRLWAYHDRPNVRWVSWERANVLRFYPLDSIRRLTCNRTV